MTISTRCFRTVSVPLLGVLVVSEVIDTIERKDYDEFAERFAARINAVKAIRIQNDRTIKGIKEIRLFMQTATGTGDNAGASLTAPTRGGKTTIIQEFRSAFMPDPEVATEKMPIVYVETPSGTGTSSLGMAILNALGDMNPSRGDGAYKQTLITKAIRRRETKLLIIDEIQRLVAKDRGRVAHNVSDWIQNLLNQISGTCGILLVGTTRARRIFRRNGHLVGRSDHHFEIKPYAAADDDAADWQLYRTYLATFDEKLQQVAGFHRSDLHKLDLAKRIHAASRGYPGATARLLQLTAIQAMLNGDQPTLSREIFAEAFDSMWAFSDAKAVNPFRTATPPRIEQVWTEEWEESFD